MKPSVLLGICGGIAAYKIPSLARILVTRDIDVRVIMTEAAEHFVTPLTLATLSGHRVYRDMWADPYDPSVEHITLADECDAAVVAPATANVIGKLAGGIADDLLTTALLAVKKPVLIAPSMNVNMLNHPVVQQNINRLKEFGYYILQPDAGWLACGWTGEGRMPDPERIADEVAALLTERDLSGERIIVTAGPTEEPLDPVRMLTNKSSGKMGVAIARRASMRGADVALVAGPVKIPTPDGVRHVPVKTAVDMYDAVMSLFKDADVVIKAAAVADFRPVKAESLKIKKANADNVIELARNPDILKELGEMKRPDQVLVGFAAETNDVLNNGRKKLQSKNLDMLVLNDVSEPGAGFDYDTNIVRLLHRSGEEEQLGIMSKEKVADVILDRVKTLRQDRKAATDVTP